MLKGEKLGAAFKAAVAKKGVKQREVAAEFKVRQSSVSEWARFGRISKEHIPHLVTWFSDVVGPEHWGLPSNWGGAVADHIKPADKALSTRTALTLSPAEHTLVTAFGELLPEDQERFLREIAERAAQMRRHALMVLARAGVKSSALGPHPAAQIPSAPPAHEPRQHRSQHHRKAESKS